LEWSVGSFFFDFSLAAISAEMKEETKGESVTEIGDEILEFDGLWVGEDRTGRY
jgi:hypothetical protein